MPRQKKYEEGYDKSPDGIAYRNQYQKEHYARIVILATPEMGEEINKQAAAEGLSRTQLIVKAVREYLDRQDG